MSDSVEAFLNRLHHPTLAAIDLSLDRMYRLLTMLGNPHKRLPPVIHVAGTNGKGSLLAYLKAIFEARGLRVHRYTSPHLVRFSERIVLAGKEIENNYLESIIKHVAPLLQQQPATFFEATTALAFLAFAEKPADILLLETGMGGRLDATNVIDKPLLTAITPISFDHTEFLGTTLSAIAAEKAGIIKHGVPCVIGRQQPDPLQVLEKKAAEMHAPVYRLGEEWQIEKGRYQSEKRNIEFTPSLAGEYQYDNAATAIACIDQLPQFAITNEHIRQGIANAYWPARLQHIKQGVFVSILPPGIELWLDGGHNPQGGAVLAQWIKQKAADRHVYLICGMIKGKDMQAFFSPMATAVKKLCAISIPGESASQPADKVAQAARAVGIEAQTSMSLENALKTVLESANSHAIICICGSLYLAGKVLAANERK